MRTPRVLIGAVLALDAVGAACWWVGVAPLPLLIAGYVAAGGLLLRWLAPSVAAAGGLVLASFVVLGGLLTVPLVLDGPLRPGTALGMLLAPSLLVLGTMRSEGAPAPGGGSVRPDRSWWAAGVGGAVLVATVLVAGRGDRFGWYAWAASGDARNHTLLARRVIADGGLHGASLDGAPLFQEAVYGLLSATHGRGTVGAGALLERDLAVLATGSCFLFVLWSLLAVLGLVAVGPVGGRPQPSVLAAASLVPVSGIAAGVLLADGFVSTLLLVPLVLATLTVLSGGPRPRTTAATTATVVLTAMALPLLSFTWTPFFGVLALACVPFWLRAVRESIGRTRAVRLAAMLLGGGAGSAYCLQVLRATEGAVTYGGAVNGPSPVLALAIVLGFAAVVLTGASTTARTALIPWLTATGVLVALVVVVVALQPADARWNYYPAKTAWTWTLVLLPMLLLPLAHPRPVVRRRGVAVGALAFLMAIAATSSTASPLPPTNLGWLTAPAEPTELRRSIGDWANPSASGLGRAVQLLDGPDPYVVFRVDPAEDKRTNFWLALREPAPADLLDSAMVRWAYSYDGTAEALCPILKQEPSRVIVTTDPSAGDDVRDACGREVAVLLVAADGTAR
jgi:hypothetical protein